VKIIEDLGSNEISMLRTIFLFLLRWSVLRWHWIEEKLVEPQLYLARPPSSSA
jgi:hypothetical protein